MTTNGLAAQNAAKAAEVAGKLKPGTYDSVQALALLSIAQSLAEIAESLEGREDLTVRVPDWVPDRVPDNPRSKRV